MEKPKRIEDLRIKLFGDGAAHKDIIEMAGIPYIKGFTTNPTLLQQAGVTNYAEFAKEILREVTAKPISFEVFSDDLENMEQEARIIAGWGKNVFVKIPVTNTKGESTSSLIKKLSHEGISLNVTAILTQKQVAQVSSVLSIETPSIVSVFAGRIADTGVNPMPIMRESKEILCSLPKAELLWASCREVYNIYEAEEVGVDIITVPYSVLHKLGDIGKDLTEYSLDAVKAFYEAGKKAGLSI